MTTIPRRSKTIQRREAGKAASLKKILETSLEQDIELILQPDVQAVIYIPPELPGWMDDLASLVVSGDFHVERTVLPRVTGGEIAGWLEHNLAWTPASMPLKKQFIDEVLSLVEMERSLTRVPRSMLRIFTEAPTYRCGFHIDTALPHAPSIGLLRVFNGPGTLYVQPENITSTRDFYQYLGHREYLGKRLEKIAENDSDLHYKETLQEINAMDRAPRFLHDPEAVRQVPEGAIVIFKHLDARIHWSQHAEDATWIHCSPCDGPKRLVVNITAVDQ